jgi:hypothetical protein
MVKVEEASMEDPDSTRESVGPSWVSIFMVLAKKNGVIRSRQWLSWVELVLAIVIWVVLYAVWESAAIETGTGPIDPSKGAGNWDLPYDDYWGSAILPWSLNESNAANRPLFVACPDLPIVHELVSHILGLWVTIDDGGLVGRLTVRFTNSSIENIMYEWEETCWGFDWRNAPNLDTPEIIGYGEGPSGQWGDMVEGSLHTNLYQSLAILKRGAWIEQSGREAAFACQLGVDHPSLPTMVGIFGMLPMVIATMRDVQLALEEREAGVQALQFLMGCPETAYFAAIFVGLVASAVLPYLALSVAFAFLFAMAGTSVGLLLLASALFILAHVFFLLFIMTFLRKARGGRAVTVVVLGLSVVFAYLHDFVTLHAPSWLQGIVSLVPMSCYELMLMSLYNVVQGKLPPVVWSGLWREDGGYPVGLGLVWLAIDALLF